VISYPLEGRSIDPLLRTSISIRNFSRRSIGMISLYALSCVSFGESASRSFSRFMPLMVSNSSSSSSSSSSSTSCLRRRRRRLLLLESQQFPVYNCCVIAGIFYAFYEVFQATGPIELAVGIDENMKEAFVGTATTVDKQV
jgi:hypothetical protein